MTANGQNGNADPSALTSGADQTYFEGLMKGEVRIQFCARCRKYRWPAVFHCPDCGSWDHVWKPVSPKGKIYSWTRTWHTFAGADAFEPPFVSIVVSLEEIPAVRLLGVLEGDEQNLATGAKVSGKAHKITVNGTVIPALSWTLD
ncbi:MAG: hypothetical protein CML30_04785 [Rhizobiales bacterium]|nr:hypothetical protein [Hyphomicrobiales bacterium]|tara:strand:- start:1450 stop:1884 length:435 start_codon:yes stop_codon:yes gene_type:complete